MKGAKRNFFMFVLMFVVFLPFINSDVVSLNSGGNTEIVINPDYYGEGFFFHPPLCGDAYLDSGEQCDDGNTNSGDGCSSTCTIEVASTTTTTTTSGGGGGGGGEESQNPILTISPSELSISTIQGVPETREILFSNTGNNVILVNLDIMGDIKDVLTTDTNIFSLNPGQQKTLILNIIVDSQQPELITGKIIAKYSGFTKEIPVVIGSKSSNFLFDISVYLGSAFKKILVGNKLSAQFNLLEVNLKQKVDVVATYVVKDFEGNKFYEKSETYSVVGEKSYMKDIPTEALPPGKYVLGFEIVYPGAFATSTDTFEVVEKPKLNSKTSLIIMGVLALVILLIFAIRFILRRKQPENSNI